MSKKASKRFRREAKRELRRIRSQQRAAEIETFSYEGNGRQIAQLMSGLGKDVVRALAKAEKIQKLAYKNAGVDAVTYAGLVQKLKEVDSKNSNAASKLHPRGQRPTVR